ncbi:esterase FE4-like [Schistocerca gregaria]|uniref:esterase FE4-like n=1 Tax=Schistocerca gregaria TaxID=7010 RepID=UPI00211EDA2B|nr:esterase FE4-like [Schistocerca gregaria]
MVSKHSLFTIILLFQQSLGQNNYVTVTTTLGSLRGLVEQTASGLTTIYTFKGVPYAEPPVAELRFKPPVPVSPWSDTKDALEFGPKCVQKGGDSGEEDCLYLNIYSPELPLGNSTLKPVMVYIHGGCFTSGSGSAYGPDYFVESEVVVVTINYRLGVLGFISTGDLLIPGNMGMKDQVEALKWVQKNIAAFGGDPDNVTIFGQSAGGASVHFHILSPTSKGLFKRGIAQSGSALSTWALQRKPVEIAFQLAENLGYTAKNTTDLMEFFLAADATDLMKDIFAAVPEEDSLALFKCVLTPSIEPEHDGAFLTVEPIELVQSGAYNDVAYMTGITSAECLKFVAPNGELSTAEQVADLDHNFDLYVAPDLRLPTEEEREEGAKEVRQFYYGNSTITLQDNYTTVAFTSDMVFGEGIDLVVQRMAQHGTQPVYYYRFSYVGPLTAYPGYDGANHSNDINYMFVGRGAETLEDGSEAALVRSRLIAMWTNFAKYGNPTPNVDSVVTQNWTRYTTEEAPYLNIDANLTLRHKLKQNEYTFWHSLLP